MFEGEILVLLGFSVWRRTNHTVWNRHSKH